ncbi:MAG: hypothetical protein EOO24_50800, partial [Comamonadaceae bacterium]
MTVSAAQQELLPADPIAGPLVRPMATAWDDLPPAWRALATGLDAHARRVMEAVDADARDHTVVPARPFRA